jgi:hypothetical protein
MTPAQTPRPLKHRRLAGVLLQNTTPHSGVAKIRIAIQQALHKFYYTRFNHPAQAGTARHRLEPSRFPDGPHGMGPTFT